MNFRVYTENTFKKSVLKIKHLVEKATEQGLHKIVMTDKSNQYGFLEGYKTAKSKDLGFIYGIDVDVKMGNDVGNFLLLAKNEAGFDFIKKTCSLSYLKNNDLIVDYDKLLGCDDIIILSGDKDSFIGRLLLNKESENIEKEIADIDKAIEMMKLAKTLKKEKYLTEEQIAYVTENKLKGQKLRVHIQVILLQKKLHLKRTLKAKTESAPVRAREVMEKMQADFGENIYFELIKGHIVDAKAYKTVNDFTYSVFKDGGVKKVVASIPYMYKDKEAKQAYLRLKLIDLGLTIEQKDSVDVGEYHIRSREEFVAEFAEYPETIAFNDEINEACYLKMTDKGYLTPIVKIDDEVALKKYDEYCDRWVSDGFKKLPLNSFFLKFLGYTEMFRRYGIQFGDDELYYMISERVFKEKDTKELQAMEESGLIEYAKEFWSDRKTNIYKGLKKEYQKVISLFDYEFLVIVAMGFVDYFIIVSDYVGWAKRNGIPVGAGRGSGPGSILAYLTSITDIDPIKHSLLFTRFLNINRISYPDIDVDFADRDKVIDYCKKKYGEDHVAQVCTFGTMASKSIFKDMCKLYNIPYYKSNDLTKLILDDKDGGLTDTYTDVVEFREEIDGNKVLREIYDYSLQLLGNKKQLGIHACAVIISPDPIYNHTIVQHAYDNGKNEWKPEILTQNEGEDCEKMGLIKMDFLGLSNLIVIRDVLADIKKYKGLDIDLTKIDYDDKAVLSNIFGLGDTDGIFQFGSQGMKKYLRELQPDRLDNIIAMNALFRPGPLQYIGGQEADADKGIEFKPSYIKRKNGVEEITYVDEDLRNSLHETFGLCVHGDTFISISDGTSARIKDMYANPNAFLGKKVVSFDKETGKIVHNEINYLFNNGTKDFFEVRFGNYNFVKTTGDHKMFVYDSIIGEVVKKRTLDLKPTDYIISQKESIDVKKANHTKEELLIMAYLLADGHIAQHAGVEFINSDPKLIKAFVDAVNFGFPTSNVAIRGNTSVKHIVVQDPLNRNYKGDDTLLHFLRKMGLKNEDYKEKGLNCKTKFIPQSVLNDTVENRAFFLAKLWDCDGGIAKNGVAYYTTIGNILEADVSQLIRSVGLVPSRYEQGYTNPNGTSEIAYKIEVKNSSAFFNMVGLHISSDDKYARIKSFGENGRWTKESVIPSKMLRDGITKNFPSVSVNSMDDSKKTLHSCFGTKDFGCVRANGVRNILGDKAFTEYDTTLLENFNLYPVKEIVAIGKSVAYDMEVANVHNYLADGVVVSNCVYQESLMQMVRDYAGFSMGEADVLRKAVGKKKLELIAEQKKIYMEKAVARGKDATVAEKIWVDIVEPFGGYGFNKSHATAYAYTAMQTAFFKYYYRAMFLAHLINVDILTNGELEDRAKYLENAISTGINITKPNINTNTAWFSYINDANVEFGLTHIKGIGYDVAEAIVSERVKNGNYTSFQNLLDRVGKGALTKKSLTALAMAGALDIFGIDRDLLIYNTDAEFFKQYMEGTRTFMIHEDVGRNDAHRDLVQEALVNEETVIGTILSDHPLSGYKSIVRQYEIGAENLANQVGGKVKVFGLITKLAIKKSAKGIVASIGVETPENYVSFTLFTKDYRKYEEKLAKFKMVCLEGDLVFNKYGQNVYIEDLVIMNTSEFLMKLEEVKQDRDTEKVYRNILLLEKQSLKVNMIINVNGSTPERLEQIRSGLESRPFGYTNVILERDGQYVYSKYCITPQIQK